MESKNIYTTSYCAERGVSYRTATGLGHERMVIFYHNNPDDYVVLERNNNTGYCKNVLTSRRISAKVYNEHRKATVYAF